MKVIFSLDIVRGFISGVAGVAGGMAIAVLIRLLSGFPAWNPEPVILIGIVTGVITYLVSLGVFRFWFRWAVKGQNDDETSQPRRGWRRYFCVDINHKVIGIQYLTTSLIFLPFAVALQLVGRLDLSRLIPALSPNTYESIISVHGLVMFFIVVIPAFTGLMNYLVPIEIGARDMAFPHLNALTFWLLPPAGLLLACSLLAGGFDTGWTLYPPLSAGFENLPIDLILLGVYLAGLSSILGAVNILATIFKLRAPGMKFFRLPIFIWACLGTTAMTLVFTQFIAMSFLMVLLERLMGMGFFNPQLGGQVLLYQYMFWFYSHPAVYVFVLLGLGMISDIIPVFVRKPLFGYKAVAFYPGHRTWWSICVRTSHVCRWNAVVFADTVYGHHLVGCGTHGGQSFCLDFHRLDGKDKFGHSFTFCNFFHRHISYWRTNRNTPGNSAG
jgi:cytochrome c oxidase subunit 1